MKRSMMISAVSLVLMFMATTLWAATTDVPFDWKSCGLSVTDAATTSDFTPGKLVAGKVVDPAALAKLGLLGTKEGDAVTVTYLGEKNWQFVHVPSGQKITKKQGTDFPANFLK